MWPGLTQSVRGEIGAIRTRAGDYLVEEEFARACWDGRTAEWAVTTATKRQQIVMGCGTKFLIRIASSVKHGAW